MLDIVPQIESVLDSKGVKVPRPNYDGKPEVAKVDNQETIEGEEERDGGAEVQDRTSSGKLEKYRMKKNHEATSDEDDG